MKIWGQMGVRGRLLLAFFGISAFAVGAAIAAMISFLQVRDSLSLITEDRVPSALASQELSRQTERVVAAAPALLTVTTLAEYQEESRRIEAEAERLNDLLAEVELGEIAAADHASIEPMVNRLTGNLDAIDALTVRRITVSGRKSEALGGVLKTHTAIQRLLAPWMLVMEENIKQWRAGVTATDPSARDDAAFIGELEQLLPLFRALQNSQLEASIVSDTLQQAASTDSPQRLKVMAFRLGKSLRELDRLAATFDPKLKAQLSPLLEEFGGFVQGENSIPGQRARELEILAEAEALVIENHALSLMVIEAVDGLVESAKQDIADATRQAVLVQDVSTGVLIAVVALSLISSVLIVWLYVGRNLIARLTALSDRMLQIAGGQLDASIPAGGGDEISRMAEALTVFRDTAIEVRDTNLREIREARRRLTIALDNMPGGMFMIDKELKFQVMNDQFKEMFDLPDDVFRTGGSLRDAIRIRAERGDFGSGDLDDHVEQRLQDYMGKETLRAEERLPSGRVIEFLRTPTDEGGTVGIVTDITDRKRAEEALARQKTIIETVPRCRAAPLRPACAR